MPPDWRRGDDREAGVVDCEAVACGQADNQVNVDLVSGARIELRPDP